MYRKTVAKLLLHCAGFSKRPPFVCVNVVKFSFKKPPLRGIYYQVGAARSEGVVTWEQGPESPCDSMSLCLWSKPETIAFVHQYLLKKRLISKYTIYEISTEKTAQLGPETSNVARTREVGV